MSSSGFCGCLRSGISHFRLVSQARRSDRHGQLVSKILQTDVVSRVSTPPQEPDGEQVVIIGAGFAGLAAAYELGRRGIKATIVESDSLIGGLAAGYEVGGQLLERFYHHWLGTDRDIIQLVEELGLQQNVLLRPTNTGMYYANKFYRLSSPLDILRFKPLTFFNRLRFGMLIAYSWTIRDLHSIEHYTVKDWLLKVCGRQVYEVVWEPLLIGKFGDYRDEVGAVWLWNKFIQRGQSRGKSGGEHLAYYRGGFAALVEDWAKEIRRNGTEIRLDEPAQELIVEGNRVTGVRTRSGVIKASNVIATPAFPIIASLLEPHTSPAFIASLRAVKYLGNICLVLQLKRPLSDTYWLNVNDPSFPFVGIIEHTNFEPSTSYANRHIVYLSKYLPVNDRLYQMSDKELLDFSIPYVQKMFPEFGRDWIIDYHVWRAEYAQPVIPINYSKTMPGTDTPLENFFISTMAHVYPQDRGTNYAIKHGRSIGAHLSDQMLAKGGRKP